MDLGSACIFSNIAAQAQADLQPVYLWAWAMAAVCLHGQCTKARCTRILLWAIFKGPAHKFIRESGQPRHRQVPCLRVQRTLAKPRHRQTKPPDVPMAMLLALQPRHQLIHSLCTYGPWQRLHFH